MNAMEEMHLTVETSWHGGKIDERPLHDPFMTHKTTVELSWLDWLKLLFRGRVVEVTVKIRGDDESIRHWFRTDP